MRVTLISKAAVVGAYQTKFEAMAAIEPALDLTVIAPRSWRQAGSEQRLERAHVEGYRLIPASIALNGRFHAHFYPNLGHLVRESRPELLHIDEEPYNLATAQGVRLAKRLGAASVFFAWQNIERRYPPPFRWLERYVYDRVAAAICGNRDAQDVLAAKGYSGPSHVIPQFGVDPDRFAPDSERHGRPFTIGYAGRLVPEKGVHLLVEALAQMGGEWQLRIVGVGPELGALEQYAADHRLAGRIAFVPPVASDQMPEQYHRLDALVLPSLTRPNWKEQFGRVLVEAMACGVPVIGSSSGEIPHVIGDAGLVFPEGDADRLRECLYRVRDDTSLRHKLAIEGRNQVLARYTQQRIAEQTIAVYKMILGQPDNNDA